jgi:hypothetical protein
MGKLKTGAGVDYKLVMTGIPAFPPRRSAYIFLRCTDAFGNVPPQFGRWPQ